MLSYSKYNEYLRGSETLDDWSTSFTVKTLFNKLLWSLGKGLNIPDHGSIQYYLLIAVIISHQNEPL